MMTWKIGLQLFSDKFGIQDLSRNVRSLVSVPAVYFDLKIPSLCLKAHGRRKLTWLIIFGQYEEEQVSYFHRYPK